MSVIAYTKEEILDALAASWARGSAGSLDALRYMDKLAGFANDVLKANAEAFSATYREDVESEPPVTGGEIGRALMRKTVASRERGLRCLDGIRYNLIAKDGRDFATLEILDWLLSLYQGMARMGRAA